MYVLTPEDLRCPASGKRAYPTGKSARAALKLSWTRRQHSEPRPPMPCRAYECSDCGWWHLTSQWEVEA